MTEERTPDTTDDPRKQSVGQGLPETNPAEASPADGSERGPEAGRGDEPPAPETHAAQDDEPSKATGNPRAAGG
jgi:hypothetical protein